MESIKVFLCYTILVFCLVSFSDRADASSCPTYSDAKSGLLKGDDLAVCSCGELDFLRNEIFARHGRVFKRDDLKTYFFSKNWYKPGGDDPQGLLGQNRFERRNAELIASHERGRGCNAKGGGTYIGADSAEDKKILDVAAFYIKQNSELGIKYKLKLTKKIGKWALVDVIPLGEFEGAGVILEKVGENWVARDFGPDLTEWEKKAPGLFKF